MDSNRHINHHYQDDHEQQQDQDLEAEEANLSPTQLLQLSETHLRLRNFTLSHQYALESQSLLHSLSSQNLHRYATQLATLSSILSSSSNHYSVLQLDTFSSPTPTQLSSHHSTLLSLLTPLKPRIPLATEGIELLTKAHFTLSDPTRKAQFDALLGQTVKKIGSFWTFCPYCFYLYEYGRCYEGCCLRCQNGKCRRVFCGVELTSLPPGDVEKGKYFGCFGYFPIGFDPLRKKVENWSPLVGMFPLRRVKSRAHRIDLNGNDGGGVEYGEGEEDDEFIEISSESDSPDYRPPKGMKRKSVARKMATRRRGGGGGGGGGNVGVAMGTGMENGVQEQEGFGVEGEQDGEGAGVGVDGNGMNVDDDVNFFEDNGEIFVELGQDDAAPAGF